MEKTIASLVEIYGSQVNAAREIGVTDRTFRNYVRNPDCVPEPMRRFMRSLVHGESRRTSPLLPHSEARP